MDIFTHWIHSICLSSKRRTLTAIIPPVYHGLPSSNASGSSYLHFLTHLLTLSSNLVSSLPSPAELPFTTSSLSPVFEMMAVALNVTGMRRTLVDSFYSYAVAIASVWLPKPPPVALSEALWKRSFMTLSPLFFPLEELEIET